MFCTMVSVKSAATEQIQAFATLLHLGPSKGNYRKCFSYNKLSADW